MRCQVTPSLGVYVLGAGDAGERQRIEEHVVGCALCQQELAHLAPLPGLLSRVPAAEVPACLPVARRRDGLPAGAVSPGRRLLPTAGRRLGRAWRIAVLTSAAAAVGVAVGLAAAPVSGSPPGSGSAPGSGGAPATARPAVTFVGANPVTHVRATAALMSTSWGTRIDLRLYGRLPGVRCELIVHSRTGGSEVAGTWNAWAAGRVTIPASAAWKPSDIASLQVTSPTSSLVTMTAAKAATSASPPR